MTAESRAAAVLAAHLVGFDLDPDWCICGWRGPGEFTHDAYRGHVVKMLAAANLLADDGQATGEPDELRAAVEALAAGWEKTTGRSRPFFLVAADELRAALAAHPPTSGSETDRG